MKKAIKKSAVGQFLRKSANGRAVRAPVVVNGEPVLAAPGDNDAIAWEFANFKESPKGLFMPQCEVVCSYEGGELKEVPLSGEQTLIFGMRPCDAKALACLDRMFGEFGTRQDPYYAARRQNAVVIALGCVKPCETCFCMSVGGDPAGGEGADILALEAGDSLVLEALTPAGKMFLEKAGPLLEDVTPEKEADARTAADKARSAIKAVNTAGLREKLDKAYDSEQWKAVSEICLGCGICTYLCPTCHCFDITDEVKKGKGRRVRTWDSCQFSLFTLHASGHNPRPSKKERMRQRIMHKFSYTVANMGKVFCVGCGRCVMHCPVNLDIRETIESLNK